MLAILLSVLIVVHLVALYLPGRAGSVETGDLDKLVHVALFAAPAAVGELLGGAVRRRLPLLLVAHAVVSELIQAQFIAHRSGELLDVLADLLGVLLAIVVVRMVSGVWRPSRRGRSGQEWSGRVHRPR